MLRESGWEIVPHDPSAAIESLTNHAIEEFPTRNGPADYALVVDGRVVGVVEAKKLSVGPAGVLTQAERYSKGIDDARSNWRGYRAPFLYSTNGEVIRYHDIREPLAVSRQIEKFHTPTALREFLTRDTAQARNWLRENPSEHPNLRSYQKAANVAVEAAISAQKRQMLVARATGTGTHY